MAIGIHTQANTVQCTVRFVPAISNLPSPVRSRAEFVLGLMLRIALCHAVLYPTSPVDDGPTAHHSTQAYTHTHIYTHTRLLRHNLPTHQHPNAQCGRMRVLIDRPHGRQGVTELSDTS
ncbi:hypothetical protein BCV70DRAFT_98117 [Testicularia cyperi]|uniref:Uncharacterized protein n=1 Tax=Testicularia cyperi TaxID=1882483 RepID=A0A317XR79_9BASI|nr:hypothetical protein BCV70DRAFT_98117 [Testicularia cyperi]